MQAETLCINGAQIWVTILYTSLASCLCFKTKDFSHECEAKDVSSIVIQIWAPFMQRVYEQLFYFKSRKNQVIVNISAIHSE